MVALNQANLQVRSVLEGDFAQAFPRVFRALQDMAVAGSKAYSNNGKRAWFGLGRDLTLESMRGFQDSIYLLAMALRSDEYLNLPAARGMSELEQVNRIVGLFFTAYPNWPDAEAAWHAVGSSVISEILQSGSH